MKANVKLMNDILNEMKGWMLHDDNSLAKTLPQLQARIKDFDKLIIKPDDDPYNNRLSLISGLFCDLEHFGHYFGQMLSSIRCLQDSIDRINRIEYNTHLPEYFCDENARLDSYGMLKKNEELEKVKKLAETLTNEKTFL